MLHAAATPTEPAIAEGQDAPPGSAHDVDAVDVALRLGVDPERGLDEEVVRARLIADGPNALAEPPRRTRWQVFVDQFRNLLIVVLVGSPSCC
jgi:magnesium-transporting ATPase (P-type)